MECIALANAQDRRAVAADAVLWQPEDGEAVWHRSRTCEAADADRGYLPLAASVPSGAGAPDLPVFAAKRGDRAARPGVVERDHVRAHAAGLDVPDGGDGLVQPSRAFVASAEHAGWAVLPGGLGRSPLRRAAGDFQHRPAGAIHARSVYGPLGGGGRGGEHGRARALWAAHWLAADSSFTYPSPGSRRTTDLGTGQILLLPTSCICQQFAPDGVSSSEHRCSRPAQPETPVGGRCSPKGRATGGFGLMPRQTCSLERIMCATSALVDRPYVRA